MNKRTNKTILLLMCFFLSGIISRAQNIDDIKSTLIDGDYAKGLEQCKSLIESNSNDTTQLSLAYGYAGLSSEALGNKEDAIAYYKEAVQLRVPQLDVYDKLISLSKRIKNDSVYEYALLEKSKVYPEYSQDNSKSLAYLYFNSQQYEKLLNITSELLETSPNNVNYLYFKGVALQNLNKVDEAEKYYTEALKVDPEHIGANMSLGMILYSKGTEIFAFRKKEYEAKAKPTRSDYSIYNKGIEDGKNLYRQALPHLLKAYESGSYPTLKPVLFNTYARLEQKEKANAYR